MAAILLKAWEGYKYVFEEVTDPRTNQWFLVAKPYQGLTLLFLYLMFVLKWGPRWMKDRKPFNLDKLLIVYNAGQVVACMYLFVNAVWYAWGWNYKWVCEPVDFSTSENALRVAGLCNFYYQLKLVDLLDTVFFVLRKKFNQVSFLHVYHHTGMVVLIWAAVTYYPGGHGTLVGVINAFVHVVMYSYYLLTVAKPSVKQSLWKKYITQLQILQFLLTVVHMAFLVFRKDCGYPRWVAAVFLPQNLFMLLLFVDFYIKAYIKKPAQKKIDDKKKNDNGHHKGKSQLSTNENTANRFKNGNGFKNGSSFQNGNHTEDGGRHQNGDAFRRHEKAQ